MVSPILLSLLAILLIKIYRMNWKLSLEIQADYSITYVTGFMKTVPIGTRNESNLLLIIKPTLALPKNTKHIAVDDQVCFHWRLIADPVKPYGAIKGLWGQWVALIRMWLVPDCCQRLSRSVLWIQSLSVTYWRHSTAVCVLMEALTRLRLPTRPLHPPASCPPTPYNMSFLILQSLWKKLLKNQQC